MGVRKVVSSTRSLSIALFGIAILIMVVHFSEYLRFAITELYYRFEIFNAEGIVWQQAMLIPGPRMYGDINKYPFIVFHYPPLYHLMVRAISSLGCTPLFAGRAISLAATLVAAATISTLTWRLVVSETGQFAALMGGAVSGLVYFCFYPIVLTSALMRVDMLAIAFSYIGFLCFTTSRLQSWPPFAGMIFFVLAVFTKQTSIAAPLAAMIVAGFTAPRQAIKLIGFGLILGGVPLLILIWLTNGGVLRHLILYNINRYYFTFLRDEFLGQSAHFELVILAFFAIIFWWRRFLPRLPVTSLAAWRDALVRDNDLRCLVMVTLYLGLLTAMLAELGKSGGGLSYFDEWIGILSVLNGVLVAMIADPNAAGGMLGGTRVANSFKLLAPVLLIAQVSILPAKSKTNFSDEVQARESDELIDKIARAEKPVLSTDMVMLMLAGKQVPWEPAIFSELASLGRWDETQITRMIAAHEFAFVVTRGPRPFTPAVARAIDAAYPRVEELAQHTLHLAPE